MASSLLVTGASGLVGAAVCRAAASRAESDTLIIGQHWTRALPADLSFIQPLALDWDAWLEVANTGRQSLENIEQKPTALIHCAAMAHPNDCERDPLRSNRLNVDVPIALARWAASHQMAFVFCSSEQVYAGTGALYGKDDECNPINLYGAQKLKAERGIRAVHPGAVIARLPLMYSFASGSQSFVQPMLSAFVNQRSVPAFVDEWRPPAHVDDVALALVKALDCLGELMLLGGPDVLSRFEIASMVCRQLRASEELIVGSLQRDSNPGANGAITAHRPRRLALDSAQDWARVGIKPRSFAESLEAWIP